MKHANYDRNIVHCAITDGIIIRDIRSSHMLILRFVISLLYTELPIHGLIYENLYIYIYFSMSMQFIYVYCVTLRKWLMSLLFRNILLTKLFCYCLLIIHFNNLNMLNFSVLLYNYVMNGISFINYNIRCIIMFFILLLHVFVFGIDHFIIFLFSVYICIFSIP